MDAQRVLYDIVLVSCSIFPFKSPHTYIVIFSIPDRKKDLVKLQAGEYVSLGKVEAELKTCAVVENICVYGDPLKQFTVALVVPNPKHLKELAIKQGVPDAEFEQLCSSPVMEKAVIKELAEHARKCKSIYVLYI